MPFMPCGDYFISPNNYTGGVLNHNCYTPNKWAESALGAAEDRCGAGNQSITTAYNTSIPQPSNTGIFSCHGSHTHVAAHVTHHFTGCNGTEAGQRNYFVASKATNNAMYNQCEFMLQSQLWFAEGRMVERTVAIGVIANGFYLENCTEEYSGFNQCNNVDLLCGHGQIIYTFHRLAMTDNSEGEGRKIDLQQFGYACVMNINKAGEVTSHWAHPSRILEDASLNNDLNYHDMYLQNQCQNTSEILNNILI